MEYITGKSNEIIKYIRKLVVSRKYRYETGNFVLEGARLCFDALTSDCEIEIFLFTENINEKYPAECEKAQLAAKRSICISGEVASKLSDTQNTQGVFMVIRVLKKKELNELAGKLIAFDTLQNPDNLGAAIRTADALGAGGAICCNCCDIYNPKALRASMGSMLRLPIYIAEDLSVTLAELKQEGYHVYSAVLNENASDITKIEFSPESIVVIGNEANGVSKPVIDISDELLTIKMESQAESLNASAATSIILWEMMKR